MAVQRAGGAHRPKSPHRPQQLLLREHARGIRRQRAQERELLLGELHPTLAQPHLARRRIDLQLAHPQPPQPPAALHPGQQRRDAGAQLGVRIGLAQVVVRSALEAPQPVELAGAPAEDEQRRVGVQPRPDPVGRPHPAQQVQAVAVGQAQVHHRHVRELALQQPEPVPGAVSHQQVVPVRGQVVGQERPLRRVVLDDQHRRPLVVHRGGGGGCPRRFAPAGVRPAGRRRP